MNHGLLSNSSAYKNSKPRNISNKGVQVWRKRNDPIYSRKLHDYVPTYISIENPMLYSLKSLNRNLCILEIDSSVVTDSIFIFTDGNAASKDTKFFNDICELDALPWGVLEDDYWCNYDDGKRKKCAEVLIYPRINKKYIKSIHCLDYTTSKMIARKISQSVDIKVTPSLFF